ncbi:hypothetical protein BDR06DRAFT_1011080 [Suillus hirtellus]|nr:hypothetical protein BDR06DRAFT_1011080 [Suillus hirtellus]
MSHSDISSSRPFGWFRVDRFPHSLPNHMVGLIDRKVKTAHFMRDTGAIDSDSHANVVEDDTDVSDVWIGPADNVDEDILPGSELDFPSSDGEESQRERWMVDVNSSVETLVNIDIDPASRFKWFVSTGDHGMGLFNDIYTARKLRAAGTTVYYFRTLSEVKEHFQTAFNAWCSEAV